MMPTIEDKLRTYRACMDRLRAGECPDEGCRACDLDMPSCLFAHFHSLEQALKTSAVG